MRRIILIALAGSLSACGAVPVAIVGDSNFQLRGSADALTGTFTATDGKLTCTGEDPDPIKFGDDHGPGTLAVRCSDGRKGVVVITGNAGHLRLTDGTQADFIVGGAAQGL
jgi:hypothetical protein